MNPLGQPVSGVDLQKVRQLNEDSLQTRATQHLTAEVKTSADSTTTEAEKLTAGESKDLVDVAGATAAAKTKTAVKADGRSTSRSASGASAPASSSDAELSSSSADSASASTSSSSSSSSGSASEGSPTPPDKPEYTEAEKQFLERMEELNKQAAEQRKMWRKIYMEWVEMQMKWREDLENFAQATYLMWEEVALSRATQSSKHAEAVRALL
jgi:hypothetical protein